MGLVHVQTRRDQTDILLTHDQPTAKAKESLHCWDSSFSNAKLAVPNNVNSFSEVWHEATLAVK